jgi:hypothetical protein
MSVKLEILDPCQVQEWDDLVLDTESYSFFHCRAWAEVLNHSYSYKPYYFALFSGPRILGLIPVLEIKSLLTGKRGVSLPFSDFCEPIILEKNRFKELFEGVINVGNKFGWRYLEIRGGGRWFDNVRPSSQYLGHRIALNGNIDQLLSDCRKSTQRNIKKALKAGVECETVQSISAVKEFFHLNCITRKRHGLPPQPFSFFKNIYHYIIAKNLGNIVLASYKNRIIAGAVFFHFGNKAIYKFGASEIEYQHLRANNLIMWNAIKWYSQNGYQVFDMGRTETNNNGLNQFKSGWGTQSKSICYYKYSITKRKFVKSTSDASIIFHKLFSNLPLPLLRIVGSLAYRHIG